MQQEIFFKLDNGLRVVTANASTQVSYLSFMIQSGSRDESKSNSGIMHLIEHLLFKGTVKRTYDELMDYIESVGGDINAYTSKEETCVYISIQNEFFERAVDVLSDIFFSTQFEDEELEKEKEVVVDEINSYKDNPQELIFDEFEEMLFAEHELAHNILGTEESVREIKIDQIQQQYRKHYNVKNVVLSYLGSLSSLEVTETINKYFSNTPCFHSSDLFIERNAFVKANAFVEKINRDSYQAHCMLGSTAPGMHDDEKTAMVLLNNLLGGPAFNSRLNYLLREKHGLTYNIESNYTAYSDTGVFSIYFGTDMAKVEKCKEIIQNEFSSIITSGLSKDVLEMYKKQLIGQIAISFDNYISQMISNAKSYLNYNTIDTYEEIIDKINNVTNEDVKSLATNVLGRSTQHDLMYI